MTEAVPLSIETILKDGAEATAYKKVTEEILKEEAEKLRGISKQADNWSVVAHHTVGAKEL